MSFISREPLEGGPARENRRARLVKGTLRRADGSEIAIVVRNLSERGLGVSSRGKSPKIDECVMVSLPGSIDLAGIVRWVHDAGFGIELTGHVDPVEITAAFQRENARLKQETNWVVSSRHKVTAPDPGKKQRLV